MSSGEVYKRKLEKAKTLFDQGQIKEFKELWDIVPYSTVSKLINTNNVRLKAKIEKPMGFKLTELKEIATFFNIDMLALVALIVQDPSSKNEEV